MNATDASAPPGDPRTDFFALLADAIAAQTFVKLVLAKPRATADSVQRMTVRPVALRGAAHLSVVESHATRDVTRNMPATGGVAPLRALMDARFSHAHLYTTTAEAELRISRKGQQTLRRRPHADVAAAPTPSTTHDRAKHRWVDIGRPFLVELGVTDATHRLIPAMARKWKQINKFVEVLDHALDATALKRAERIAVADFGSGKGYLTFALHDHLRHTLKLPAEVTGVELRDDMVALCNTAAERLDSIGLHFERGDVATRAPATAVDVMIALHACDTATDHAIHAGIRAGAAIIMCSPCCHKELRPQLLTPHPLRPILKHGIHLGQQAEMLTDGLRAMLLDACGYDTRVFEFVALEHTNKNKMILAVKRSTPSPADAVWAEVRDIKAFYGIRDQCLERLLIADRSAPASSLSRERARGKNECGSGV